MNEQGNPPEEKLSEHERSNLPGIEFKVMIIREKSKKQMQP